MSDEEREARVRARAVVFAAVAERFQSSFAEDGLELVYRADAPVILSAAYFLLNDAYKQRRAKGASLTDDHKKAAVSAVAVMVVRPFAPLDIDDVTFAASLANPIYALASGGTWLGSSDPTRGLPFDYLKRFYISLLNLRIPSLDPFIDSMNHDGRWQEFSHISLTAPELDTLDDWVWRFFMLSSRKR